MKKKRVPWKKFTIQEANTEEMWRWTYGGAMDLGFNKYSERLAICGPLECKDCALYDPLDENCCSSVSAMRDYIKRPFTKFPRMERMIFRRLWEKDYRYVANFYGTLIATYGFNEGSQNVEEIEDNSIGFTETLQARQGQLLNLGDINETLPVSIPEHYYVDLYDLFGDSAG